MAMANFVKLAMVDILNTFMNNIQSVLHSLNIRGEGIENISWNNIEFMNWTISKLTYEIR